MQEVDVGKLPQQVKARGVQGDDVYFKDSRAEMCT